MTLLPNLISYWKLDESSGNASDAIGINTLTNNGTMTYSTGIINNGAVIATGKYLSVADGSQSYLGITSSISMSCWINLSATPASGHEADLVGKWDNAARSYLLYLLNTAGTISLNLTVRDGAGTDRTASVNWTPLTSTWYHIVVTADRTVSSSNVLFYVNGSQQGATQSQAGTGIQNNTGAFYIGFSGGGETMTGTIDEVGVWSTVLTSAQVTTLYNGGSGKAYSFGDTSLLGSIKSYWKFDESSGNAADSVSVNTLTNNNTATFAAGKINNGTTIVAASSQSFTIADASQIGLDIIGDLSVSGWVKFTTLPGGTDYGYIAKYNAGPSGSFEFDFHNASGIYKFEVGISSNGSAFTFGSKTITIVTATWYHFAATYTASTGTVEFFQNGSSLGTTSGFPVTIFNSAEPFRVGDYNGVSPMNGMIDEVGIWARVLTSGEITTLYNSGTGIQYPFTPAVSSSGNFLTFM